MNKISSTTILLFLLIACAGREDDLNRTSIDKPRTDINLALTSTSKPALIVFGAGWCKSCLKEIKDIEHIHRTMSEEIEVLGYLVEGFVPGVSPTLEDVGNFDDEGVRTYKVVRDEGWQVYQAMGFSQKSLPTLAIVDAHRNIITFRQSSLSSQGLSEWVRDTLEQIEKTKVVSTENLQISQAKSSNELEVGPIHSTSETFTVEEYLSFYSSEMASEIETAMISYSEESFGEFSKEDFLTTHATRYEKIEGSGLDSQTFTPHFILSYEDRKIDQENDVVLVCKSAIRIDFYGKVLEKLSFGSCTIE